MDQVKQGREIAKILVAARKNNEDVGNLIAAALHQAMQEANATPEYFVQARDGSWEANIVMRWAAAGGNGNPERIKELVPLFAEIGEAKENGGEIMSLAVSFAVDALKGFEALISFSPHYWDLANLGAQFSKGWNDSPYR